MSLARKTLEKLLASAERAQVKGTRRAVRARLDGRDSPYLSLSLDQREQANAYFTAANQAGAVALMWNRYGGEDRPLDAVTVSDAKKLAEFLKIPTQQSLLDRAASAFAPWRGAVPALDEVLEIWRGLQQVRRRGPEDFERFVDAAKVITHMAALKEEATVRVVSRQLFRDSKRIEALIVELDALTAPAVRAPSGHWEDVLSGIGLRKAPLPLALAGKGHVHLQVSGQRELAYEYLAVSPGQVTGFTGDPQWVLCVENWTTFELVVKTEQAQRQGLILFTGGMPSPVWRRALAAIVSALPVSTPVYHWGDIDVGGFRIAAVIASTLAPRPLLPWLMDPTDLVSTDPAEESMRQDMVRSARRAGWTDLAQTLESFPPAVMEQEDVPVQLPSAASHM